MVFNNDILFIHIGKTGGTSIAKYLCQTLSEPVYNVIPEGVQSLKFGNEINQIGQRHATLEEALSFTTKNHNLKLKDFKKVIAVIRHPYNLEISLFNYYKRMLKNNPTFLDGAPKRKEIVLKDNFESFVKGKFYHRNMIHIKKYVSIEGKIPKHVEIIKFEEMTNRFLQIGKEYGNNNTDFPHMNKTKHAKIRDYITPETELIIFRKYKWVFKYGNYERLKFS